MKSSLICCAPTIRLRFAKALPWPGSIWAATMRLTSTNCLTDVVRLEPPEPASGMQGFWHWTPPASRDAKEAAPREMGRD